MKATKQQIATVFANVFGPTQFATTKLVAEVLDEDSDGEDYRARIGRWRREATATAKNDHNWRMLVITHVRRMATMHLMYWMQKEAAQTKARR